MIMSNDRTDTQAPAAPASWTNTEFLVPLRRSDVRIFQVDDEAVLFDSKTHRILLLNQTALAVLSFLLYWYSASCKRSVW